MKKRLWTRNFTAIILASFIGSIGGIAGNYALSFMVYAETNSTLATAIITATSVIPGFFIPMLISPAMDRIPRKPVLVAADATFSVLYLVMGLWLLKSDFNYITYLIFSLIISSMGSIDELTYNSIYPMLIPEGMEEKGYTVSSMLYPVVSLFMMPAAAWLYTHIGTAKIILLQSLCALIAAIIDSTIQLEEHVKENSDFSFKEWIQDLKDAVNYMRREKGILSMTIYSSVSNGMYSGYQSLFPAFFSSFAGFTIEMYSLFTVFEFVGRSIGGIVLNKKKLSPEQKAKYASFIYLTYDLSDAVLLWLPYKLMLLNRTLCGYLGIQSGTLRYATIQRYIPNDMRARINALTSIIYLVFAFVFSLFIGALGELLDLRLVMTIGASVCLLVYLMFIVRNKEAIEKVYTDAASIEE